MPESSAIQRTRDAMDTWLHKGLPADFNQLRADLHHILHCIPDTHANPWGQHADTWTRHIPEGIALGAVSHTGVRLHCAHCEWDAVYTSLDLRSAIAIANDHTATH